MHLPAEVAPDHGICFHRGTDDLAGAVAPRLGDALAAGAVCVVVAVDEHRRAFEAALTAAGVDLAQRAAEGSWLVADAAALCDRLTSGGGVRRDRFESEVAGLVRRAAATGRPLMVFGEIVGVLWDAGRIDAAIELEDMWNELAARVPLTLLCAYPATPLGDDADLAAFEAVCRAHAYVDPPAARPAGDELREHRAFAGTPDAPGRARRFVVDVLRRSGRHRLAADAALVVSEMATNAVRHAHSAFTVTLSSRDDAVRIAVADHSDAAPAPRDAAPLEPGGRGLQLIAAVARRWGATMARGGKVVWAELAG